MAARLALAAAALALVAADVDLSDEQFYSMPPLFALEDHTACLATRGVYCLGSFELAPQGDSQLFTTMQRYSENFVSHFNHTLLHRGVCVSRRCSAMAPPDHNDQALDTWFTQCINESTTREYNLSAQLLKREYCQRGPAPPAPPLSASERALAAVAATLLALAAVSTGLDYLLNDEAKKSLRWALSWSLPGCWRALTAGPPARAAPHAPTADPLRALDGLRVLCMMCVIVEHICWLGTLSYVADTRSYEQSKQETEGILLANSTLVVQIFFLMSSFLLAHKLLTERGRKPDRPAISSVLKILGNRVVRLSPSYFIVVWFAGTWWTRAGGGALWGPLVEVEAAVCRRKWWTHLLYLNNVLLPDDKCLIQTWYLAADLQLYVISLVLILLLWRLRAGAVLALAALLVAAVSTLFVVAYSWNLFPLVVMHNPELVRMTYRGEASFNVLYQSAGGNLSGALVGLLLAHAHHLLAERGARPQDYRWFRWSSWLATPAAVWWAASSPRLLGPGPPPALAAAALAAVERSVFALCVGYALLGALHGVESPWRSWFSWPHWATPARLCFGALLLHMPIDKAIVASRVGPTQIDPLTVVFEWCSVALVSWLAAVPLALLVELPAQRLFAALCRAPPRPAPAHKGT